MKLMGHACRQAGFTLTELLIVIAVIGVLASALATVINPKTHIDRANDARRKSDIATIQSALEQYRADNSAYPPTFYCGDQIKIDNVNGATVVYLQKVPCDPTGRSNINYFYNLDTNGNYCLRACMDSPNDKQADAAVYGDENFLTTSCGVYNCSYPGNYTVRPQ